MAGPNITLINIYYYITTFLCYVYFLIHDVAMRQVEKFLICVQVANLYSIYAKWERRE